MIRAVIFDLDGTILDTEKLYCRFWVEAARYFGFDWRMEHSLMIRSMAAEYARPFLAEFFGESFSYDTVKAKRRALMGAYMQVHPLEKKPGIDELLAYLRAHYYKTAVATATEETKAMTYLDEVGLLDRFDQVISASMVAHGKPMGDVYQYVCEKMGEKPENCIAVEDSPNGILSAYRAGCKPVMVPDLTEPDACTQALLYAKIDHLTDLEKILKTI